MSDHNLAEALRNVLALIDDLVELDGADIREAREALAAHEAEQQAGEAVACWTLKETLDARQTTCSGRLLFSDPKNSAWAALFTHPQQPLTREQVKALMTECGYDQASPQERADFINGIRHAEKALGIGITKEPANAR